MDLSATSMHGDGLTLLTIPDPRETSHRFVIGETTFDVERRRRRNRGLIGGDMQVHVTWDGQSLDLCDMPGTVAIRGGLPILRNDRTVAEIRRVGARPGTRTMLIEGVPGGWSVVRRKRRSAVLRADGSVLLSHSGAGPRTLGRSYWHARIDAGGDPDEIALAIGLWLGGYLMRTRLLFLPETASFRHPVPPVSEW